MPTQCPAPASSSSSRAADSPPSRAPRKRRSSERLPRRDRACKRENKRHFYYFRPKSEVANKDGVLRRLLIVECGQEEEREGYYSYAGPQLLEYDDGGRLSTIVAPSSVTVFEWSADAKVAGGKRVRTEWNSRVVTDGLVIAKASK